MAVKVHVKEKQKKNYQNTQMWSKKKGGKKGKKKKHKISRVKYKTGFSCSPTNLFLQSIPPEKSFTRLTSDSIKIIA